MTDHIHKRLTEEQVRTILERYLKKELSAEQGMDLLGIKRRQFFKWVKKYKENSDGFTIEYSRKENNRKISEELERSILSELTIEKVLIDDPAIPLRFYNYSYIQDQLLKKYQQKVSLPTIIDRAKKRASIFQRRKRKSMIGRL